MKKQLETRVVLPLAPMASVFTILLVILIQANEVNKATPHQYAKDISLPKIQSAEADPSGNKIEVSPNGVYLNGKKKIELNNFRWVRDPQQLETELRAFHESIKTIGENDAPTLVYADENTPYQLINQVLLGISNLKTASVQLMVSQSQ